MFLFGCASGDVLNIDPLNFYSQLYRILPRLHAGQRQVNVTCAAVSLKKWEKRKLLLIH